MKTQIKGNHLYIKASLKELAGNRYNADWDVLDDDEVKRVLRNFKSGAKDIDISGSTQNDLKDLRGVKRVYFYDSGNQRIAEGYGSDGLDILDFLNEDDALEYMKVLRKRDEVLIEDEEGGSFTFLFEDR